MKTQSVHITIPTPCHESWTNMDATDKGAFCHSCQKEVIDFTIRTDREVVEYLQKYKSGCGRFRTDQVNANLSTPKISNGLFKWKAMLVGLLPILSAQHLFASAPTPPVTDQSSIVDSHKQDTAMSVIDHDIEICGTVVDEKGEGLIGAAVILVDATGKNSGMGAAVDFDGNYSFLISKELFNSGAHQLKAVSIGYQTKIIRLSRDPSQEYNITMAVIDRVLTGDMIVVAGGFRSRKLTPAQKIKYWFRRTFHPHPKY
jgi:hypothetical protein